MLPGYDRDGDVEITHAYTAAVFNHFPNLNGALSKDVHEGLVWRSASC